MYSLSVTKHSTNLSHTQKRRHTIIRFINIIIIIAMQNSINYSWHFLPLQSLSPVLPLRNSDRKAVGYGKFQATVFRIPLICSEHIMVHTTYYINIPTVFPNSTKPLTLVANSPEKAKQRPNQPLLRSESL